MKIYLDSIGCRLNQSEIEAYARQFRAAGHLLVPGPEEADLMVINTCSVTSAADSDSRHKIRQAARLGPGGEILVTGCWSTLNPHAAASLPGVARVVPNSEKDHLVADWLKIPLEAFDKEPLERFPIPGARARTRLFIKAQDGCDNRCTFCVTTLARGEGRSRPASEVVAEIQASLLKPAGRDLKGIESGVWPENIPGEIVLSGVHLGSWGHDFHPRQQLHQLVETVLQQTDVPRLRLSSLEPWDLDEDFFALWENPRLCRHLHLPLQSGCEKTLRRMARNTTPQTFTKLISAARSVIPDVAITTDIIVGFPGEDELEFSECLDFVRQMRFAGGHVFTYSTRPGTAAARMPRQVPHEIRKERNARMRQALVESAFTFRSRFLGQEARVLWESATALDQAGWRMSGLTDNYLKVHARLPGHFWNRITTVRLTGLAEDGLDGTVEPLCFLPDRC